MVKQVWGLPLLAGGCSKLLFHWQGGSEDITLWSALCIWEVNQDVSQQRRRRGVQPGINTNADCRGGYGAGCGPAGGRAAIGS